jgi:hypothetical protein
MAKTPHDQHKARQRRRLSWTAQSTMTRDHVAGFTHQNWIRETERPDAAGDLSDLRLAGVTKKAFDAISGVKFVMCRRFGVLN